MHFALFHVHSAVSHLHYSFYMFLTCIALSILEEWSGWVVSLPNLILFEWVPLLSWVPSCSPHLAIPPVTVRAAVRGVTVSRRNVL